MADPVGGLYATVSLDINDALRQLKRLEVAFERLQRDYQTMAAGGNTAGNQAAARASYAVDNSRVYGRAREAMQAYLLASEKVQNAHRAEMENLQRLDARLRTHGREIMQLGRQYEESARSVEEWRRIIELLETRRRGVSQQPLVEITRQRVEAERQLKEAIAATQRQEHQAYLARQRLAKAQGLVAAGVMPRVHPRRLSELAREEKQLEELRSAVEALNAAYTALLTTETRTANVDRQLAAAQEQLNRALRNQASTQQQLTAARRRDLGASNAMIRQAIELRNAVGGSGGLTAQFTRLQQIMRPASYAIQSVSFLSGNRAMFALAGVGRAVGTAFSQSGLSIAKWTAAVGAAALAAAGFIAILHKMVQSLIGVARYALTSASSLERTNVAMRGLLGSQEAANAEIARLRTMARESPFFFQDILQADRLLIALGFDSQKTRTSVLQAMLDIAAAVDAPTEKIQDMALALGQVQAAGRLTGDEARQLHNNYIKWTEALRLLPKYAGMTGIQMKQAMEQGQISADEFFTALIAYSEKFSEITKDMAKTLSGTWMKLADDIQFGLGEAFAGLNWGDVGGNVPINVLRDGLQQVYALVQQIDLRPLAAGFGNLIAAFVNPSRELLTTWGPGLVNFFNSTLPSALTTTANFIGRTIAFVRAFGTMWGMVWSSIWQVTKAVLTGVVSFISSGWQLVASIFGRGFSVTAEAGSDWVDAFANIGGGIAEVFQWVAYVVESTVDFILDAVSTAISGLKLLKAFTDALVPGVGGGWDAVGDAWSDYSTGWNNLVNGPKAPEFGATFKRISADISGALNELKDAFENFEIPDFGDIADPLAGIGEDIEDITGALDKAAKGGGGRGAEALANQLSEAMNTLFDLTKRWFGMRSEVEAAFLGPNGFTATVESIAAMGKQLIGILDSMGLKTAAAAVDGMTRELIKLAERRDRVAARLEKARERLEAALQERKDFARQIRDAAYNFATALTTESATLERIVKTDRQGFFYEAQIEQTKSFSETLKERVKALKAFQSNIKTLMKKGLSRDLIEQLLTAGPEAGGAIAAELATSSKVEVASINKLQKQADRVSKSLGEYGAKQFKTVGVLEAKALVLGLESQLKTVENAALGITDTIYNTILPFAKEAEKLGKDIGGKATEGGGGVAGGLTASGPQIEKASMKMATYMMSADALTYWLEGANRDVEQVNKATTAWSDDKKTYTPFDLFKESALDIIGMLPGDVEELFKGWVIALNPGVDLSSWGVKFWSAVLSILRPLAKFIPLQLFPNNLISKSIEYAEEELRKWQSGSKGYSGGGSSSGGGTGGSGGGGGVTASSLSSSTGTAQAPNVKVYIGDQELRSVVNTEIEYADGRTVRKINAGRIP